jgi:hypothetical protein
MDALIADDLFWSLLDVERGKLTLPSTLADIGMSAALLCELILGGHVGIRDGYLWARDDLAVADRLGQVLVERTAQRARQESLTLQGWLAVFSPGAAELVADRLVRNAELTRSAQRRLGRTTTRLNAAQPPQALIRSERVWSYVRSGVPLSGPPLLIAALLHACEPDEASAGARALTAALASAPALPPPFPAVLGATHRAVEVAVTHRA